MQVPRRRRIASFDVGMRNLAVAVVDVDEKGSVGLVRWELIDLEEYMEDKKESVVPAVVRALDAAELSDLSSMKKNNIDVILIENQPCMKNPRMKTVQVAIHTFFESMKHYAASGSQTVIRLVNASNKVKLGPAFSTSTYSERKRLAVAQCKEYLQRSLVDGDDDNKSLMSRSEAMAILDKAKKKDDLADAFMQALWFVSSKNT